MSVVRVLGIDTGLKNIGWAVLDVGAEESFVAGGTLQLVEENINGRMKALYLKLTKINQTHGPFDTVGYEEVFFREASKHKQHTAYNTGGILLCLTAAQGRTNAAGYNPQAIKEGVTGDAQAYKRTVENLVGWRLAKSTYGMADHETDAIAVAMVRGADYILELKEKEVKKDGRKY